MSDHEEEIHRLERKLEKLAAKIAVSERRTHKLEKRFTRTRIKALELHARIAS